MGFPLPPIAIRDLLAIGDAADNDRHQLTG